MRAIQHLFSGKDNATADLGRVLWALTTLAMIGLAFWAVIVRGQPFDPMQYAGAFAVLLPAGAGGLAIKAHTEPGG